jgi:UDP-glucose 4-epimerase
VPHPVDAIFHLAAQSSGEISHDDPLRDFDVNARGTLGLLQWAEARGVKRFLHASSMAVYGPTPAAASEDAPLQPRSFYGAGKIAAEAYVRLHGVRGMTVTIFRMFNVYGSGQNMENLRQGMASIYMAFLLREEPIVVKGSLDRFRDFIHVNDVVDVWLTALTHPGAAGRTFNVGTGRRTTVRDLVDTLGRVFGFAAGACPHVVVDGTAGDISGNVADIAAAQAALGWAPRVDLYDGLAEMAQWARGIALADR